MRSRRAGSAAVIGRRGAESPHRLNAFFFGCSRTLSPRHGTRNSGRCSSDIVGMGGE